MAIALVALLPSGLLAAASAEEAAASFAEPLQLDVNAVIERVRAQNLQVLIEKESVQRALQSMYQERASLLPSIELNARQTRSKLSRGFVGDSFDPVYVNNFDARFTGTQTLFDVQRFADYRIARLNYDISQLNYEAALQDVLESALSLYFAHLRDLRALELSDGTIRRDQELYDLTVDQFDAGVATKIDITRAEVELARARRLYLQNQTNVQDSGLRFKVLLDIDLAQPIELDRSPMRAVRHAPDLSDVTAKQAGSIQRPEVRSAREQLAQAQLARKAAQLQRLPTLELFGEWGYSSDEAFDGNESEAWMVGIQLSMPIFEGFRITAEAREARAAVRQNEYRLKDIENTVAREFEFARLNLESRFAQIGIASEEERLALDELELARERYREGLADNRELIDAQQRLDESEDGYVQSVYLYLLSRIAFARAAGQVEQVLD